LTFLHLKRSMSHLSLKRTRRNFVPSAVYEYNLPRRLDAEVETLSEVSMPVITKRSYQFFGRHLIASYVDCDPISLKDVYSLTHAMERAARACGATVLKSFYHVFPEGGVTSVLLLSESHASVHTYPEYNACFVDVFTCGEGCDITEFDAVLQQHLKPAKAYSQILVRGQVVSSEERVPDLLNRPRSSNIKQPARSCKMRSEELNHAQGTDRDHP
jgi:S-adenosylmethionine decarboxylase